MTWNRPGGSEATPRKAGLGVSRAMLSRLRRRPKAPVECYLGVLSVGAIGRLLSRDGGAPQTRSRGLPGICRQQDTSQGHAFSGE